MAHPQMYADDDPWLARLRAVAGRFPECTERVAHGRPTFRAGETGKVFAYFGATVKQPDGHERHDAGLLVLPDPGEQQALADDDRTWVPAYLGPSGWVGLDLDRADLDDADFWREVAELLDASYRRVARATLLARLDEEPVVGSLP